MPPWKPKRGYGSFAGERGLSAEQIATIRRWVEHGKQEGSSADLPPLPQWESAWELGQPDLIASMTSAYTLRADGPDVFRNFAIPLPVDSTRYVKALEFRPGNARIVHHATMMIDRSGAARRRDGRDGAPGFDGMSFGEAEDADGHFLGWTQGKTPYPGSDSFGLAARSGHGLATTVAHVADRQRGIHRGPRRPVLCRCAAQETPGHAAPGPQGPRYTSRRERSLDPRCVPAARGCRSLDHLPARALPRSGDSGVRRVARRRAGVAYMD